MSRNIRFEIKECIVRVWLLALTFVLCLAWHMPTTVGDDPSDSDAKIDFVKDVQPILQSRCSACHGNLRQESEYRIDVREIALGGGANYAPNVIPFRSGDSPLIQFVTGQVDGMLMPAKGERLTEGQIAILRRWIDQGAHWPDAANRQADSKLDWWSLRPLQPVVPPPVSADQQSACATPVDAFILAELDRRGLAPSPSADRRQWIRRVTYDLIGLPPDPEATEMFANNAAPDARERVVDRLLASPRHGERWARYWMDVAHFAETHGHDQDRIRQHAWPYRDYLVDAFNEDLGYAQFIRDQLAADVFSADQPARTAALGFLAAGPWDESTLRDIREDTLDREIGRYLDRDDMLTTVMSNVVSLTVHCARCHDHKFDPIPQSDYYALQAVFAGVERANRRYDSDPSIARQRAEWTRRLQRLMQPLDAELRTELLGDDAMAQLRQWESTTLRDLPGWSILAPGHASASEGSTLTPQDDGSVTASGQRPDRDTYEIVGRCALGKVTGLRLEVLTDPTLPKQGPGRQDNGNLHLSEIEVQLEGGRAVALRNARSDFDQADWGIAAAIDNNPQTAWGIYPQVGKPHEAVFELVEPIEDAMGQMVTVRLKQLHGSGHLIGRPRIALTSDAPPLLPSRLPSDINDILVKPWSTRTEAERLQLAVYWQREVLARQLAALPEPRLVYAAAADFEPDGSLKPPPGPRAIHVLSRGDIRFPGDTAAPGALQCLNQLSANFENVEGQPESARRAALAQWLTDGRNPLTWRSIVNRIWQQHFGRGLVETPNDFGRLGAVPSHPQLLDWLASRFRDSDQSFKWLHRQIVLSSVYSQSSRSQIAWISGQAVHRNDRAVELDIDNRLLWRMHRIRLGAECVRDAMLACSGQLDLRMGGPSDRQFDLQPGRHVTPVIDYLKFDLDSPAGQRRSIYRFLFRTLPDPFMEALDCPAGDQITPTRSDSVTVQQALAMWNDAFVLKQAQHLAQRLEREAERTTDRVERAMRLTLGRAPNATEIEHYVAYVEQFGLANFCRVILNTNEFLFID